MNYLKSATSRSIMGNQLNKMAATVVAGAPAVLRKTLGGGPHGLGDPDDTSLRKVEVEILIPKVMREKAKIEKCAEEVKDFSTCCKDFNLGMVIKCRKENSKLRDCLSRWYEDTEFKKICTEQYLKDRTEFRRTGVSSKYQH